MTHEHRDLENPKYSYYHTFQNCTSGVDFIYCSLMDLHFVCLSQDFALTREAVFVHGTEISCLIDIDSQVVDVRSWGGGELFLVKLDNSSLSRQLYVFGFGISV